VNLNLGLECSNVFNWEIVLICMNKKGFFTGLIILIVLLVVGFFWFVGKTGSEDLAEEKCVPASCCHASECVWESEAPNCSGSICTAVCMAGSMDCGAGECGVVDGSTYGHDSGEPECEVIWNE